MTCNGVAFPRLFHRNCRLLQTNPRASGHRPKTCGPPTIENSHSEGQPFVSPSLGDERPVRFEVIRTKAWARSLLVTKPTTRCSTPSCPPSLTSRRISRPSLTKWDDAWPALTSLTIWQTVHGSGLSVPRRCWKKWAGSPLSKSMPTATASSAQVVRWPLPSRRTASSHRHLKNRHTDSWPCGDGKPEGVKNETIGLISSVCPNQSILMCS